MGRLPIIGVLNKLDNVELLSVLSDVKGNIISQYQTLLAAEEIDLEFTEQFLLDLLNTADSQGMGARSLRSVLDSALISVMFRAPELKKKGVTQITFTEFGQPPMLKQKGKDVVDKNYTYYRGQHEERLQKSQG